MTSKELIGSALFYISSLLASVVLNHYLSLWGRRLMDFHTSFQSVPTSPCSLLDLTCLYNSSTIQMPHELRSDTSQYHSPVFDLGLYFLPHLDIPWLPDVFVVIQTIIIFLVAFLPPINQLHSYFSPAGRRPQVSPISSSKTSSMNLLNPPYWSKDQLFQRMAVLFRAHAFVLFARCSTNIATIHRPSPRCVFSSLHNHDNAGYLLNFGCFDLMFSGHSSFSILVATFAHLRPDLPLSIRILFWISAIGGAIVNIIAGDHFTADVVVATYIAAMIGWLHSESFRKTFTIEPISLPTKVVESTFKSKHID